VSINVVPLDADKAHEAAVMVHQLMSTIAALLTLSKDGNGFAFLRSDLDDLTLSYRNLGFLLAALQTEKAA
jgi:hypothetical protein